MATSPMSGVVQHLYKVLWDGVELTDGQLLEVFISHHDEAAFAALVRRHGPMVWGVCRRVLHHQQDSEEAFQATFLVLVRRAASIASRELLANWLYGVAHQTALKARATAAKRKERERQVTEMPEPAMTPEDPWRDVQPVLDEELSRLPAKYRGVIVLCELEGLTRKEAAKQLGLPEGTVASRLVRARTLLAKRLTQRGIAMSAGALAMVLTQQTASAAVPNSVVISTIKAATMLAAGKAATAGVISVKVAALTEGVMKAMFVKKIGLAAKALIVLTLVAPMVGRYFSAANAAPAEIRPEKGSPGILPLELFPLLEKTSARAEEPEPITLKGHTGEVTSVCFSPDGKRILTGGGVVPRGGLGGGGGGGNAPGPGEVKVWDAEKGTEFFALKGHDGIVMSVCFSPDGKRIASAGALTDHTVRVWDAEKETEILVLKDPAGSAGSVCFSPDGKRIATISLKHITVWDAEKGQELLTLKAEWRPGVCVCFSPDGKRIASVHPWNLQGRQAPALIKVWDAVKGEELLTLKGHTGFVHGVCFSPDGKRIASAGGADQTIRVWDAEKGQELLALEGHTANVSSVCFSPDGKRIASGSWDKTVKVWDAEKGEELQTLKGHDGLLRSVCFSPDGKRIASGSTDKTVKVWDLLPGKAKAK